MELRDFLDELNYYFQGNRREEESAKELFMNVYNHPMQSGSNPVEIPLSTYRKYINGDSMRAFCKNLLPGLCKDKFINYINTFGDSPKEDLIEDFSENFGIILTVKEFGTQLARIFIEAIKEEAKTGIKRKHKKKEHKAKINISSQNTNNRGFIDLSEVIERFSEENSQSPDLQSKSETKTHQELKVDRFYNQHAQNIINIEELKELKL